MQSTNCISYFRKLNNATRAELSALYQPPYAIAASKEKRLSTWCTFRGHTACPQESHLISSSLHVINLPPQCYCSNGHSSSFREKGIDQASLRNAFVRAVNRKKRAKLSRVYETSSLCCALAHVWAFMCERVRVCVFVCVLLEYKQQD